MMEVIWRRQRASGTVAIAVAAALAWTALVAGVSFTAGYRWRDAAQLRQDAETLDSTIQTAAKKAEASLDAGIRLEQRQDATDRVHEKVTSDYESDKKTNPGIGCVLDPVSLRRWNEANAGPDGPAGSESDDAVPGAPARASRTGRGDKPPGGRAPVSPVSQQGHRLD